MYVVCILLLPVPSSIVQEAVSMDLLQIIANVSNDIVLIHEASAPFKWKRIEIKYREQEQSLANSMELSLR
jgi:hypothetical protein